MIAATMVTATSERSCVCVPLDSVVRIVALTTTRVYVHTCAPTTACVLVECVLARKASRGHSVHHRLGSVQMIVMARVHVRMVHAPASRVILVKTVRLLL